MEDAATIRKLIIKTLAEIDQKSRVVEHLQQTLELLGLTRHSQKGDSSALKTPSTESASPTTLAGAVIEVIRKAGRAIHVNDIDMALAKTILADETDHRIRRRKISQAIYTLRSSLQSHQPEGGSLRGYYWGLKEWFDGKKLKKGHEPSKK